MVDATALLAGSGRRISWEQIHVGEEGGEEMCEIGIACGGRRRWEQIVAVVGLSG